VFSNADETESYMSKFYKSSSQNYRVMTQGSQGGPHCLTSSPCTPVCVCALASTTAHTLCVLCSYIHCHCQGMATSTAPAVFFSLLPPLPPSSSVLQHSAEQFERLLQDICADEDGDLLVDSAVKGGPRCLPVATLVNFIPAMPFIFRNYQVRTRKL